MGNNPYVASRMVSQAKWFALAKVGVAIASLLTQFVLVRNLGVDDYAAYTIFVAGTAVLVFVTMFGMDRVVYRFMPPLREAIKWREVLLLMLGLISVRLLCMLLLLVGLYFFSSLLLPQQIVEQSSSIPLQYIAYGLSSACNDSLLIFCNCLGLQKRQAVLFMLSGCVRLIGLASLVFVHDLTVIDVANVFSATECVLSLALLLVLAREFVQLRRDAPPRLPLNFGFSFRALWRDSLGTQAAYMLGLPFRGALLKLIVGSVATPLVTASFGFFQTLSDRAYQFMPIFLAKGIIEPSLASDYSKHHDIERIRSAVSLLLRFNYVIIGMGIASLLGCGEPLINWVTHGRYGGEMLLAVFIVFQLAGMSLGESLFLSLNPIGRISHHNRLWLWFSLPFLGLLGLCAYLRSPLLLVLVSTTPYYIIYGWLRWVNREPSLQKGLGIGLPVLMRLVIAVGGAALVARLVLLLPGGNLIIALSLLCCLAAFVLALRFVGLFKRAELPALARVSPRFSRLLEPISS
ncbi:hypothetical protein ACWYXO_11005 [Janthinobacterium aestuarii]